MKIYAVFGVSGEYSDRKEWPVKAFWDEGRADKYALDCIKEATRLAKEYKPVNEAWTRECQANWERMRAVPSEPWGGYPPKPKPPPNLLDPSATDRALEGVDYFVYAIPLEEQ